MSQQEFESQQNERSYDSNVQENSQESEARPYYWSTRPNTGNIPKNEHPANFEDSLTDVPPIPPYSYQAQDRPAQGTQNSANTPPQQQSKQWQKRSHFSPDGDAFEQGYQPYGSYNRQVPPWARPQRNKGAGRMIFFIVLGFILIKPLLLLLGGLFIIASIFFGLLLFVGLGLVALFIIFAALGRPFPFGLFRSRRPWGRWRGYI